VYHDHSDGLHPVAWNNGHLEPTVGFNYSDVEDASGESDDSNDIPAADEQVAWADVCAGWTLLLEWIAKPESIALAGARAHTLLHWLTPSMCRYGSLEEIAKVAGVTRACLSKHLMDFRKQISLHIGLGKSENASERYSQAQKASYATGNHSSFTRADRRDIKP
jgi:hypothetical protein